MWGPPEKILVTILNLSPETSSTRQKSLDLSGGEGLKPSLEAKGVLVKRKVFGLSQSSSKESRMSKEVDPNLVPVS